MKMTSFYYNIFIIKLIGFILPLLISNFLIVRAGFLYSEKNPEVLTNLARKSQNPHKFNILFLGTSRTNHDLSPEAFINGFGKDQQHTNGINLGYDGYTSSTSMALFGENKIDADLVIIEIYTGNPMDSFMELPANITPAGKISAKMSFLTDRYIAIHRLYNIIYHLLGKNPVKYSYCHDDGWCEIDNSDNPAALAKVKLRLATSGIQTLSNQASMNDYYEFSKKIKTYIDETKTTIIFIILPVHGTVKYYQTLYFERLNPLMILKSYFASAHFIDVNNEPFLNTYHTFDDSHLSSTEAKSFSYRLGYYVSKYAWSN